MFHFHIRQEHVVMEFDQHGKCLANFLLCLLRTVSFVFDQRIAEFREPNFLDNISASLWLLISLNGGRLTGVEGVIAKSGVLTPESSGNQIEFCYLYTVFEFYSSYHLGQAIEAA